MIHKKRELALKRIKRAYYTGYLNFINEPISHVLLLILAHILLPSCLYFWLIKNHVMNYCITVYERNGKKLFWPFKKSGEILYKLKSKGFLASSLSIYDFSSLYATFHHNLIKDKLTELNEQAFNREGSLYMACNENHAVLTSEQP